MLVTRFQFPAGAQTMRDYWGIYTRPGRTQSRHFLKTRVPFTAADNSDMHNELDDMATPFKAAKIENAHILPWQRNWNHAFRFIVRAS